MNKTLIITRRVNEATMSVTYHTQVHLETTTIAELEAQEPKIREWIGDIMLKRLQREIQDFDNVVIREVTDDDYS